MCREVTHPVDDLFVTLLVRFSPERIDTPDSEFFLELIYTSALFTPGKSRRTERSKVGYDISIKP